MSFKKFKTKKEKFVPETKFNSKYVTYKSFLI